MIKPQISQMTQFRGGRVRSLKFFYSGKILYFLWVPLRLGSSVKSVQSVGLALILAFGLTLIE
jgi:hypothetical protein